MNGVAVHGWNMPSMDGRPVGGRKPAMRCMAGYHGNPSLPWMVGIHERDATYQRYIIGDSEVLVATCLVVVLAVVIDSAYHLWIASPYMNSIAIYRWQAPLVVRSGDEM